MKPELEREWGAIVANIQHRLKFKVNRTYGGVLATEAFEYAEAQAIDWLMGHVPIHDRLPTEKEINEAVKLGFQRIPNMNKKERRYGSIDINNLSNLLYSENEGEDVMPQIYTNLSAYDELDKNIRLLDLKKCLAKLEKKLGKDVLSSLIEYLTAKKCRPYYNYNVLIAFRFIRSYYDLDQGKSLYSANNQYKKTQKSCI